MTAVRLHIGEQETVFMLEGAPQPLAVLPIGTARPGGRAFRSSPPSALDLEAAIEGIENAVMPLAKTLPAGARLVTQDALAARVAAATDGVLSRDAVEHAFSLLAEVAEGRPASHAGELVEPSLAGYLLILREVMHHLGFASVTLIDAGVAAQH